MRVQILLCSLSQGAAMYTTNSNYLKSITDTSGTEYDEIIIVMDNVSTKKRITIAANVTSTVIVKN